MGPAKQLRLSGRLLTLGICCRLTSALSSHQLLIDKYNDVWPCYNQSAQGNLLPSCKYTSTIPKVGLYSPVIPTSTVCRR
jgi:hypothetical protein